MNTQPLTATGAPSQTSTIPYYLACLQPSGSSREIAVISLTTDRIHLPVAPTDLRFVSPALVSKANILANLSSFWPPGTTRCYSVCLYAEHPQKEKKKKGTLVAGTREHAS